MIEDIPTLPKGEDQDIAIAVACFGLFLLVFGLSSLWLRGRVFLTSSVLAMTFGILLGPRVLDVVKVLPGGWDTGTESDKAKEVLLWFTRIVLAIQVLSAGVTLPCKYVTRRGVVRSLAVLLGPVMLGAVVVTGCFVRAIFGIGWWESMLVGACLAPTDPVLASSVIKGVFAETHCPPYIRQLLLGESGINDGAGTPYFLVPLLALTMHSRGMSRGAAVREYALNGLLWETAFPVLAGCAIGYVFRRGLETGKRRKWVDKESSLVYTLALAMFTCGLLEYIDSNELLACFFAGTVMNWNDTIHVEDLHTHFSEGIDNLLDIAVFLTLGTVLPWSAWAGPDAIFRIDRLVGFGVLVLVFRRLPLVLLLQRWIPMVRTTKEAFFIGWFGPMGIGALYYALKAAEELPKGNELKQGLFGIVSWIVFTSTIVHGVTLPTFLLGSAVHPALHPKYLVRSEPEDDDPADGMEANERSGLLRPVRDALVRYGAMRGTADDPASEGEAEWKNGSTADTDMGRDITRSDLHRILADYADAPDDTAYEGGASTKRGGQGRLNVKQKESLFGEGSGLEHWDQGEEILVYDEGDVLILTTEDGHVATRRITRRRRPPHSRAQTSA